MNHQRGLCSLLLLLLFLSGASYPCLASKKDVGIITSNTLPTPANTIVFGTIPSAVGKLMVLVENARVVIKRGGTGDIAVMSNCPRNWSVQGAMIRQAGFAEGRKGSSMMADALGSRAIVNGKIYPLPQGSIRNLSMNPSGVSVGGQPVEPIKGSDVQGSFPGPDLVEIHVPETYSGGLTLGTGSGSKVEMQTWTGGSVELILLGNSTLTAEKLSPVEKAVLDLRGDGSAEIGALNARVVVANVNGNGSLTVKSGSAEMSNATVSGNGKIVMRGKFKNLQQSVDGKGTISVTD